MDELDLDGVDFDAVEKKNAEKIDQMNEEAQLPDEDEGDCAGGGCKI